MTFASFCHKQLIHRNYSEYNAGLHFRSGINWNYVVDQEWETKSSISRWCGCRILAPWNRGGMDITLDVWQVLICGEENNGP